MATGVYTSSEARCPLNAYSYLVPNSQMAKAAEAVAQMKLFPKSDDFAVLLGLRESQIGTPPPRSEQHRVDVINLLYVSLSLLRLSRRSLTCAG